MKHFKKNILMFFILFLTVGYAQENNRQFYEVQIIRIACCENRDKDIRITINSEGKIEMEKKGNFQISNLKDFTESINKLMSSEEKVVKVPGDNEERGLGMQAPYNKQNIYISLIYLDDYNNEQDLINNTCYRYRETNIDLKETKYSFYKYFSDENINLLMDILK